MNDDLNQAAREADRMYREAEETYRGSVPRGVPAPYLVTLMFFTEDEAHKVVEQIKQHGGLFVMAEESTDGEASEVTVVSASVADMRRWGDRPKVYRSGS